jgi:HAD superfamily hydrolase (TIGR01549 family)
VSEERQPDAERESQRWIIFHDKYKMSIITNGFEEIQNLKLTAGKLHKYFDHIVTSQHAGFKKPSREIFDYTLSQKQHCQQSGGYGRR